MNRVVILGLGGAAERILLPGISRLPDVELVAGCDPNPAARPDGLPRVYDKPQQMFIEQKPDIAIIATPPVTHPELCLLALEHGCHVFCEKPFMPSVEDADRVIEAARQKNRILAVNNQYYQMPIYKTAKALIDRGEAGRLFFIEVAQHMRLLPEEEGGWKAALGPRRVLYEFGTHALDLVCQFFGAYPVSVTAQTPLAADVLVVMRLDFPGNRVANVVFNRVSHAPTRYLEMRLNCEQARLNLSLGGVAGLYIGWNGGPRVRFSLTRGGEARVERNGRSRVLVRQPGTAFHDAAAAHFSEFLSAIRNGTEPPLSAGHAREVLAIVFAGYRSAAEGGTIVSLR